MFIYNKKLQYPVKIDKTNPLPLVLAGDCLFTEAQGSWLYLGRIAVSATCMCCVP